MTRFFVVKCSDTDMAEAIERIMRDWEKIGRGSVEVVEIIPEKRDLSWWERATVNKLVKTMDGDPT